MHYCLSQLSWFQSKYDFVEVFGDMANGGNFEPSHELTIGLFIYAFDDWWDGDMKSIKIKNLIFEEKKQQHLNRKKSYPYVN